MQTAPYRQRPGLRPANGEHDVNAQLLLDVLVQITEHPETHDQAEWLMLTSCGTAGCVAGWTVVMAGHPIAWYSQDGRRTYAKYVGEHLDEAIVAGESIPAVAERELRLDPLQAERLFAYRNTLPELWNLASEFTCRAIPAWAEFSHAPIHA